MILDGICGHKLNLMKSTYISSDTVGKFNCRGGAIHELGLKWKGVKGISNTSFSVTGGNWQVERGCQPVAVV